MADIDLETLASILSGGKNAFDPSKYIDKNPYYNTGNVLSKVAIGGGYPDSWQGALARTLTGLAGGAMSGYGQYQGQQEYETQLPILLQQQERLAKMKEERELVKLEAQEKLKNRIAQENFPTEIQNKIKMTEALLPYELQKNAASKTEINLPGTTKVSDDVFTARVEAGKGIKKAAAVLSILDTFNEEETIGGAVIRNLIGTVDPQSPEGKLSRAQDIAVYSAMKPLFVGALSDQEAARMAKAMAKTPNMTIRGLKQVYRDVIVDSATSANVVLEQAQEGGYEVASRYKPLSLKWEDYYKPQSPTTIPSDIVWGKP